MTKKVRDVLKALKADGWEIDRTKKHRVLEHPTKKTLNGLPMILSKHDNEDLPIGTYNNILKNAGLK